MRLAILWVCVAAILVPSTLRAGLTARVLFALDTPAGFSDAYENGVGGGSVVGSGANSNGKTHAVYWSGIGPAVDLHPTSLSGFTNSYGLATDGIRQVGYGTGTVSHALLWSGTGGSAIDLHPTNIAGITSSQATAVGGGQAVGYGSGPGTSGQSHALVWNDSAGSAVDLSPAGLSSFARATDGTHQVGYGIGNSTGQGDHALLWSGTAGSVIDLHPTNLAGYSESSAEGVKASQQVGFAIASNHLAHAMLWNGSSGTAVDLTPTNIAGISTSYALATNGVQQVGEGYGVGSSHALLWNGTANTTVDLQALLPPAGVWNSSEAVQIDAAGNVFGTAYGVYLGVTASYPIEWSQTPVPEPTALASAPAILFLGRRRVGSL